MTPAPCVVGAGLVVRLPLDETAGSVARDLSGAQHPGVVTGGVWQASTGPLARSLRLSGTDHLYVPLSLQPTAFSVAFWMQPTQLSNYSSVVSALQDVYPGEPWGGFGFHTTVEGSLAAGMDYEHDNVVNGRLFAPAGTLVVGQWQHFVFTYNAANNGTGVLYRNGVRLASLTRMPRLAHWQGLLVGEAHLAAYTPFNGSVADLRVYTRAISAAEALTLAQCRPTCPVLALTLPSNLSIERGQATRLDVLPPLAGVSYTWSPATGLNTTTGTAVVASPLATTTYTVTARGDSRCPATTRTVTVSVVPPPPLLNPPVDGCTSTLANAAPAGRTGPDTVNFVRTYTPRVALTDTAAVRRGTKEQVQVRTEYLDGLGRPLQTVLRQESPRGNDVVQPMAYDALGRQPRQYAPYVAPNANGGASGNAGAYRPNGLREQYDFYRQASPMAGPGNLAESVTATGVAYAETAFEASPLNRVLAQASPGEAWALLPSGGHAQRRSERPNTLADAVPRFVPGYEPTPNALAYPGDYPAGELWLTETTDEQGLRSQEFKDKQGLLVAKRVENPTTGATRLGNWLSTYYAYDEFPRLRTVVPPKAAVLLAAATPAQSVTAAAELLLFRYRYDGRGRVVAKQVTGQSGESYAVYDALDRPVLTQDPAQRARQQWSWLKYDALARPVLSGLLLRPMTLAAAQAAADAAAAAAGASAWEARAVPSAAAPQGYTLAQAYPRLGQAGYTEFQVLTVAHYDDYNFDNDAANTADAAYDTQSDAQFAPGTAPLADARTTGLPTRSRTRVLGVAETDPAAWLSTTTFYDERARPIQVQATNARAGLDLVTSQLDFAGKTLLSVAVHHGPNLPAVGLQVVERMGYDHAGRLLGTRQQVLGADPRPVRLDTLAYNEIGQLLSKDLASGALTQQLYYRYNVRGWLTDINSTESYPLDRLFNLALRYECGFTVPQFNGNISGQKWRGRDGIERAYGYLYDGANRLVQGDYIARGSAGRWSAEQQRFALRGVRYDENGNILALQRRGLLSAATRQMPAQFGPVDDLTYAYDGNRLRSVQDAVTTNTLPRPLGYSGAPTSLAGDFQEQPLRLDQEYFYDNNGSMTADRNKGITNISYNHLNLPQRIAFGYGSDSLVFRYSAAGQKVAKLVYQTGQPLQRTDYLGPYQYEQDSLRFFPHAEGRTLRFVNSTSGAVSYQREFTLKDHLGNLRMAYRAGQRRTYAASLEPNQARRETQQFDSASVSAPIAQPVGNRARTGTYVARLNAGGAAPQPLGALKQLGVQKGDTVLVTAHALYPQASSSNPFVFSLATFVAGLLSPAPGLPRVDGRRGSLPLLNIGVSAALPALVPRAGGVPLAYLRLLVFNADSSLQSSQTQQLTSAALNNYERLQVQLILPQDGYVTAYVGNESNADVFFDDIQVEHRQGLQVQETQYDPYGMTLAGLAYHSPGIKSLNQYLYNSKEFQADLGLGLSDYGARMYDGQLGRWHGVDPLADQMRRHSPFNYAFDNPMRFIDPDGRAPVDDYVFNESGKYIRTDKTNKPDALVIENSKSCKQQSYQFNDPVADVQAIKNGIASDGKTGINKAETLTDGKIEKMMDESGVKSAEAQKSPFSYAWKEGANKMDYGITGIGNHTLNGKTFYLREGVAYNIGDIGNYLFGRGAAELGISVEKAQAGGQVNNMLFGRGQKTKMYDFGPGTNGPSSFFDSSGDQKAIYNGHTNSPAGAEMLRQAEKVQKMNDTYGPKI